MALSRVANSSLNQTQEYHFTANASFLGANTFVSGTKTTLSSSTLSVPAAAFNITSANTLFSSNVNFANTPGTVKPIINFASANVQGLPAGGANPATTTVFTAAQRFAAVGISAAGNPNATVTLNLANNNYFDLTLANNIVLANPTGISNTQGGSIFLTQDGTGNRTVTFGQYWRFPSGAAPSLSTSANAQDRIDYVVKSSNTIHASVTLDLLGT